MKKQNLLNLVRYHVENKDGAFRSEVAAIAQEFDAKGDEMTAQTLMEMISTVDYYYPQAAYKNLNYLKKVDYSVNQLILPSSIEQDVIGITRAIHNKAGLNKFLFYGKPGTGKTECAYQIARILQRDILSVNFEELIDSRLGETAKNITKLFDEINHLQYDRVIVVFDEIDALVLDRVNQNDLREMGRVTSVFLRELDKLNVNATLIATTNLFEMIDKALIRRFDAIISFDRYRKNDLIEIADSMLTLYLKKSSTSKKDMKLFNKILNNMGDIPYPGDLKQIIKTSVAFSDEEEPYDYLRKIYLNLNHLTEEEVDLQKLKDDGYTVREIEILSKVSKSSVARKLKV